jgi:hypothetical protein
MMQAFFKRKAYLEHGTFGIFVGLTATFWP